MATGRSEVSVRRRRHVSGKKQDMEKARFWRSTIREAARSGVSVREFCRERKLRESQFYWWQRGGARPLVRSTLRPTPWGRRGSPWAPRRSVTTTSRSVRKRIMAAGRSESLGYVASTVRPMFTGQVRDPGSRIDYFRARYYVPGQGRFTSPDPNNAGADPADPQTWNAYAYVGNNPMTFTDPSGLGIFGDIGGIIGSFFPGFGSLIGWGIGSIADLATGQSISPPGFNIGGAIFGSIAGSGEQRSALE